jgi:hypothetical protein
MGALLAALAVVNDGVVEAQGEPAPVAQAAGVVWRAGWVNGGRGGGGQMRMMVWRKRRASPHRSRKRLGWVNGGRVQGLETGATHMGRGLTGRPLHGGLCACDGVQRDALHERDHILQRLQHQRLHATPQARADTRHAGR